MNLNHKSPILIDFVPVPLSMMTLKFRLKGSEDRIKINVGINVLYKDPSIDGRIFLLNPGVQNIYTSTEDRLYTLKFNISQFKDNILSYIHMVIDPTIDSTKENCQEIIVECIKVICKTDSSEQILISKDILKDIPKNMSKNISSQNGQDKDGQDKDILPQETISPQAAMVVPHTQPRAIKTSPWTPMNMVNKKS